MSLHCIVWCCMVLYCWLRRAGCISQDTYLLYFEMCNNSRTWYVWYIWHISNWLLCRSDTSCTPGGKKCCPPKIWGAAALKSENPSNLDVITRDLAAAYLTSFSRFHITLGRGNLFIHGATYHCDDNDIGLNGYDDINDDNVGPCCSRQLLLECGNPRQPRHHRQRTWSSSSSSSLYSSSSSSPTTIMLDNVFIMITIHHLLHYPPP